MNISSNLKKVGNVGRFFIRKRKSQKNSSDLSNLRLSFEEIAAQKGLPDVVPLTAIKTMDFIRDYGSFGENVSANWGSLQHALYACFPSLQQNTLPPTKTRNWTWKNPGESRRFFDHLGEKMGVSRLEDWYSLLSVALISLHGGNQLLRDSGCISALAQAYPEYPWKAWNFKNVELPRGFWYDKDNCRGYLMDLAQQRGYTTFEDWYSFNSEIIHANKGYGLLKYFQRSYIKAITSLFPEYDWKIWKFRIVPREFLHKEDNVLEVLEWISKQLNLRNKDDWYSVSWKQIDDLGFSSLRHYHKSLFQLLSKHYPDHRWDRSRFYSKRTLSSQEELKGQSMALKTISSILSTSYPNTSHNFVPPVAIALDELSNRKDIASGKRLPSQSSDAALD